MRLAKLSGELIGFGGESSNRAKPSDDGCLVAVRFCIRYSCFVHILFILSIVCPWQSHETCESSRRRNSGCFLRNRSSGTVWRSRMESNLKKRELWFQRRNAVLYYWSGIRCSEIFISPFSNSIVQALQKSARSIPWNLLVCRRDLKCSATVVSSSKNVMRHSEYIRWESLLGGFVGVLCSRLLSPIFLPDWDKTKIRLGRSLLLCTSRNYRNNEPGIAPSP